ncbi:MAG: type II toxin-antitoxin system VapC family toxin [Caulobacteraceae bacterium]
MRLLVDTHALIWALTDPSRLSRRARSALEDAENDVWVSAASGYEIEFKRPRDAEIGRVPAELAEAVLGMGFAWLAIDERHTIAAGRLPRLHGDPFDRLLAAQALVENLSVITRDRAISAYGPPTLW